MLFLSWDIGIKNLAYCLLEYTDSEIILRKWEVINLFTPNQKMKEYNCDGYKRDGNLCQKKSLYYHRDSFKCYCKVHSKKFDSKLMLDVKKITCSHILKNKKIRCDKKISYHTDNCFIGYCKTHSKNYTNLQEIKKLKKEKNDLEQVSEKLVLELDARKELLAADYVLIENQPAYKNPKMKSIQMIVYSYFLIRGKVDSNINSKILFLLASNKLKVRLDTEDTKNNLNQQINNKHKDKYRRHKEFAKSLCQWFIENKNIRDREKWLDIFNSHQKRDDLADTFLMNIYQIQLLHNC